MKNRTQKLIKSLSEVFEGKLWYGESVMEKLENVPYVTGDMTCVPQSHTVAQIIAHLIAWKSFALEKIKSNSDFDIAIDSNQDWPDIEINSPKDWETLKQELVSIQSEIYKFLEQKEDGFLGQQVTGRDYTFEYLLYGIIHHDIYHLGQIGLIQSQLKRTELNTKIFKAENSKD